MVMTGAVEARQPYVVAAIERVKGAASRLDGVVGAIETKTNWVSQASAPGVARAPKESTGVPAADTLNDTADKLDALYEALDSILQRLEV